MEWNDFVSLENILKAWKDFLSGKQGRPDVIAFKSRLEDELLSLHSDFLNGNYCHAGYTRFIVHDPKKRVIHKASVRDRVVHRMIYNAILPIFDRVWLDCSFACRPEKGQHISIERVLRALNRATDNYTRVCIAVKCDVRKFFDNIDHEALFRLLCRRVRNSKLQSLLWKIIASFEIAPGRGIPLGNLSSQVFANVYLHQLDLFAKHTLKIVHYYRYADDILMLFDTEMEARTRVAQIGGFLQDQLRMNLHPEKTVVRKSLWGIDWLGQVLLQGYRVLRPVTRRRMMRRVEEGLDNVESPKKVCGMLGSYWGLIKPVAHIHLWNTIMQKVALRRDMWYG